MSFDRPDYAKLGAERKAANLRQLCTPSRTLHSAKYGAAGMVAVPKTAPRRNKALLEMAQGRRCLLRVDGVCTGDTATTVACHSNLSIHGQAGARKADDCYSVWGCIACHRWLDQGDASAVEKEAHFTLAHMDQVLEWKPIAADAGEPARFRRAAQWALDQLNATP